MSDGPRARVVARADVVDVALSLEPDGSLDVGATLHLPAPGRALPPVLLLPGARGDHAAPHLVALARHLAAAGAPVVRARLWERPPGAGVVPPAERAVGRSRAILAASRALVASEVGEEAAASDWVIGGASYGGRVASLAIAAHGGRTLGVCGLLAVAYPLHPPAQPDRLRTAHWPDVDVPVLLLSGDADPFLTVSALDAHEPSLPGPVTRLLVAGAAHDLSVTARRSSDGRRRAPEDVIAGHAGAILDWLEGLAH